MVSFKQSLVHGAICVALAAGTSAANAQVLDPAAYTSAGVLSLASGAYTLDTDALTFNGYSGVLSNGIAVFDFSNITVAAGATVNVIGSHPLALLSQSDAIFGANSSFNLNGGAGGIGLKIPAASGGSYNGMPGTAGAGGYVGGGSGNIYGGGLGGSSSGGGGSFGGSGGGSYPGLPPYGNLSAKLDGGSGGGAGRDGYSRGLNNIIDTYYGGGGGGGGGGAIEISATGSLSLSGTIGASGGAGGYGALQGGGGGAGGGILLSGRTLQITSSGSVKALGGNGGLNPPNIYFSTGGGGGGCITIQTLDPNGFSNSGALNVDGGNLGSSGSPFYLSAPGVITVNGRVTNTPAPGSLLVAVLGAVPVVAMLRRRRK